MSTSMTKPFAPIFINGRECLSEQEAWRELLIYVPPRLEREPDPIQCAIERALYDFAVNA